jgi:hypothetical protein
MEKRMPTRSYTRSYNRKTNVRSTNQTCKQQYPTCYRTNAPGFSQPRNECQWRMMSYRTIYTQFSGPGKSTVFSPTTAHKWINYINTGCRIYKFSNKDFTRHFGNQWENPKFNNPNTCYRWMRQKFGAGVKAVTRGRANTWLVAATPNVCARPFQTYTWK